MFNSFLTLFCSYFGGRVGWLLALAPKQVNEGNYASSQAPILYTEVVSQEIHGGGGGGEK